MERQLLTYGRTGIGQLDDLAVVGWVLKSVHGELDAFRAWEHEQDKSAT